MTLSKVAIPLAEVADSWLGDLTRATGVRALAALGGATLLGERAMLGERRVPGRTSAGGGCGLYEARDGAVALNLARSTDRELLPALFEDDCDFADDAEVARRIAGGEAAALVARGRLLGLAIAAEAERVAPTTAVHQLVGAMPGPAPTGRPRVLDLSALWAGPLAAHLLWLAGADVIKIESPARPDAMRDGDPALFALLDQGKTTIALDPRKPDDRAALLGLIAQADIVIEAARPRALRQLGIDADAIVAATPGLTWLTITGHGATGTAANWVGFGDDAGVAGGLSAALRRASGRTGFVGDAIADPLTGLRAAATGFRQWQTGQGGRFALALSGVAALALDEARSHDAGALDRTLRAWAEAAGRRFPSVRHRGAATPC